MKRYEQLTQDQRVLIGYLRLQGLSIANMASQVGCHRSTVYRELDRNSCYRTDGAYRPSKAQARAKSRLSEARKNSHFSEHDFDIVKHYLRKGWSPEQISGRLSKLGIKTPSHETIYRYIWTNKHNGGELYKHLRQSIKQRRKRHNSQDSRGRLANKRHIRERPQSANTRKLFGHWEIDTVVSRASKDCIVTINERKSGFVLIGKLKDRTTQSLNKKVSQLINNSSLKFKTITADNGTEFNQYQKIEQSTGAKFYFANAYHSWERGSNENLNGLIRQYIPKGASMKSLTQLQCDSIANRLNSRPRKRYNYKTPEEIQYAI